MSGNNASEPARWRVSNFGLVCVGLCVAAGMAVAGYFVSQTLYRSKVAVNIAEVKGLAERRVQADRAGWTVGYRLAAREQARIPELYQQAERAQQRIVDVLHESGFAEAEITPDVVQYEYRELRDDSQQVVERTHVLEGSVTVETDKVGQIAPARVKVNRLITEGIQVSSDAPKYYFTKLNDIKPDMLSEATRNARAAANEFAANAGVRTGGIRSARQGGFQVRDVGADYGDTGRIDKEVRVVTTITFYLTE